MMRTVRRAVREGRHLEGAAVLQRIRAAAEAAGRGVTVQFQVDGGDPAKIVWVEPGCGPVARRHVITNGTLRGMRELLPAVEELFTNMVRAAS